MSNIINNNFNNLRFRLNDDEYWDFFINKDYIYPYNFNYYDFNDKCLISYIDADIDECIDDNKLLSVDKYKWEYSLSVGDKLENIGYTGLDNGLIPFRRDTIDNKIFLDIYTNSIYELEEGDTRLKLHQVSGGTNLFEYPITVLDDKIKLNGGFYQGFFKTECDKYQVLPSNFEIGKSYHFEFMLNKSEFEKESDKTLNDKYPNNKGIFFYIGTRAENKWAYLYNDDDECFSLSPEDYVEDGEIKKNEYKINNFLSPNPEFPKDYREFFLDDYLNFKYFSDKIYSDDDICEGDFIMDNYIDIDNKPIIIDEEKHDFERINWCCKDPVNMGSCKDCDYMHNGEGYYLSHCELFGDDYVSDLDSVDFITDFIEEDLDISDFEFETDNGIKLKLRQTYINTDNKFLLFDRTYNAFTVNNWIEGSYASYIRTINGFNGNLFLLMHRANGGYDVSNIDKLRDSYKKEYNIYKDIYNNALAFRITDSGAIGYRYLALDCDSENDVKVLEGYSKDNIITEDRWHVINVRIDFHTLTMRLNFYVDGKLVFVTDEMPKLELRKLHDIDEKQEGVPYNISLGGGTQGLAETILPNYMLDPYRTYPLEEYFAGSFIGYLKYFKLYDCYLEYLEVNNNFKYEMDKLNQINIY